MKTFFVCLPGVETPSGCGLGSSMPVACSSSFAAARRGRSACVQYRCNVLVYSSAGVLVARFVYNRVTGSPVAGLRDVPRSRRVLSPSSRARVCWCSL